MIRGCDISFYNDKDDTTQATDFKKMRKAGAEFVIIRYNQGIYTDSDLEYNYKESLNAELIPGSYHLYDYRKPVEPQIEKTLELLRIYPPVIQPWLDVEYVKMWDVAFPVKKALKDVQAFLQILETTRKRLPYFYSNPDTILYHLKITAASDLTNWILRYPLAVAHYYVNKPLITPWNQWAFWQYTNKGHGPSYGVESAQLDLDYFSGTREELLDGWKPKPTYAQSLDAWARSMGFDGPPLP